MTMPGDRLRPGFLFFHGSFHRSEYCQQRTELSNTGNDVMVRRRPRTFIKPKLQTL